MFSLSESALHDPKFHIAKVAPSGSRLPPISLMIFIHEHVLSSLSRSFRPWRPVTVLIIFVPRTHLPKLFGGPTNLS